MPVVGFMHAVSAASSQRLVAGFVQGLGQSGYVVGKNVAVRNTGAVAHQPAEQAGADDPSETLIFRQIAWTRRASPLG